MQWSDNASYATILCSHNGNFLQWMGRLSYSFSTVATDELELREARASANRELTQNLWNTAKWQNPAFDKASYLRVIHIWSSCETLGHRAKGKINSLIYRSLTAFRPEIFCWWPGIGSWNASFEYQQFLPWEKCRSLNIATTLYCVLNNILTIYVKLHFKWYEMYCE